MYSFSKFTVAVFLFLRKFSCAFFSQRLTDHNMKIWLCVICVGHRTYAFQRWSWEQAAVFRWALATHVGPCHDNAKECWKHPAINLLDLSICFDCISWAATPPRESETDLVTTSHCPADSIRDNVCGMIAPRVVYDVHKRQRSATFCKLFKPPCSEGSGFLENLELSLTKKKIK